MSVRRRTGDRALRSLPQHNVFCAQQVLPTDQRCRHGIPSITHSVQSLHGEFREDSVVVRTKPPSIWLRCVDDTFVEIHEYDVDGPVHINSIDSNIQFTTEPELKNKLPFLDLCIHVKEDGVLKSRSIGSPHTHRSVPQLLVQPPPRAQTISGHWSEHLHTEQKSFNKISIQGSPQMAVDWEARSYRESTHIVIISVPCPYTKYNLP